jgi:hypothetical protein
MMRKLIAVLLAAATLPIAVPTTAEAWTCPTWTKADSKAWKGTCNKPAPAWPKNMLGVWCSETGGRNETEGNVILYGGRETFFKEKAITLGPKSYRTPNAASGKEDICTYERLEVSTGNYRSRIEFAFTARCVETGRPQCRWTERATGWAFAPPAHPSMEIKWTETVPVDSSKCEPE